MLFNIPSFGVGFLAGFVSGFSTRELVAAARPFARGVVKMSIQAMDKSREVAAHIGEGFDDLVAEVRSEMEPEAEVSAKAKAPQKEIASEKSHGRKAMSQ